MNIMYSGRGFFCGYFVGLPINPEDGYSMFPQNVDEFLPD
jgi:hypothetical protein